VVRNAVVSGGVWSLPSVDLSALAGQGAVRLSVVSGSGAALVREAFIRIGIEPSSASIDRIVPTVSRIDLPAQGQYAAGREMIFTLQVSEATAIDTTTGMPTLDLALQTQAGARDASAVYDAAASSPVSKVFRYQVPVGETVLSASVSRLQLNRAVTASRPRLPWTMRPSYSAVRSMPWVAASCCVTAMRCRRCCRPAAIRSCVRVVRSRSAPP
jgi:hypothetical protein